LKKRKRRKTRKKSYSDKKMESDLKEVFKNKPKPKKIKKKLNYEEILSARQLELDELA